MHRGTEAHSKEKAVHHLVETYRRATGKRRVDGITMDELAIAERVFQVNVQVYMLMLVEVEDEDEEQDPCKSAIHVELIRRSHPAIQILCISTSGEIISHTVPILASTANPTPAPSVAPCLGDLTISYNTR